MRANVQQMLPSYRTIASTVTAQCKEENCFRYSVLFFHIGMYGSAVHEPDRNHGLTVLNDESAYATLWENVKHDAETSHRNRGD